MVVKVFKKVSFLITLTIFFSFIIALPALAGLESEIQNSLICPACFSDGMTVAACNDSTAQQIKADITKQLAEGKTKDQILEGYVKQYGEKILTNPPKKGFNIMAWVIPFIGIFLGGVLIYIGLSQWVKKPKKVKEKIKETTVIDEFYEAKVEDEFKKYL